MSLSRRSFLEAIVAVAGTLQGCSSSSEPGPPAPPVEDGRRYFPQSVASGDPRPESVVLWTRLADEAAGGADGRLTLEVATDAAFQTLVVSLPDLPVLAAHDHTLRVKVVKLEARKTYYYRFVNVTGGKRFASPTGRTKTAALPSDDVPVRFAVACCQDFSDHFYNSWQYLTDRDEDLDFVLFVGDYVYETAGDPSFQEMGGARSVSFSDPASALTLGSPASPYLAAKSVSNYRDLYKTFRSDIFLQAAHERYPFVFMWDDHEYSDDCYGATATYDDGKSDETNVERRRNAEKAYFEYVPLDLAGGDGVVDVDAMPLYPITRIYRDLRFGKNVSLIVADSRTERPDHLIPEDAYPGKIVMTAEELAEAGLTQAFADDAFAYVNVDAPEHATTKALLGVAYQELAKMAGLDPAAATQRSTADVRGPLAVFYINAVFKAIGLPPVDPTGLPRGIAWVHMGKRDLFSGPGSRYVVIKDTFDAYAAYKWALGKGTTQDVYGPPQRAWLDALLRGPEAWKILVSSVSMTSLVFDLRDKTDLPDPFLKTRFYLDADQWDGFPDRKKELLGQLAATAGSKALVVSGDIHASFASVEGGVACLTAPAISSQSVKAGAAGVAVAAGFDETSSVYRYVVTDIDGTFKQGNPGMAFSDTDGHGFLVVEVRGDDAVATFHTIPSTERNTDYAGRSPDLAAKFVAKSLRIVPGSITPM